MSDFVTAKNIILNYDFFSPTNEEGRKSRGTAYEFQDYAYRLACDLNDLDHLNIYMGLAKKYPRYILDQTYEYVADITEENKGRLFMWKFGQVKQDIQLKKDLKNFGHDFVIKKTAELRNDLCETIFKKYENLDNNILAQNLHKFNLNNSVKQKALILGLDSTLNISGLIAKNYNVYGLDIAKNLTKKIKNHFKKEQRKFISKNFLKNKYKDNQFDLVVLNNFWNFVCLESEQNYIDEIKRISKQNCSIIMNIKLGTDQKEEWKQINGLDKIFYLAKVNTINAIEALLSKNDLKIINKIDLHNHAILHINVK